MRSLVMRYILDCARKKVFRAVGDLLPTMNAPLFLRGAFLQVDSLILFVFFLPQLFGKFRHALMMNPKIC